MKAQVTTLAYDTLGRLTARTDAEGASQWVYDTAAHGKGKPASVTGPVNVSVRGLGASVFIMVYGACRGCRTRAWARARA